MVKKILLGVVAVVVLVLVIFSIIVAMQPNEFRVARSTQIAAEPPVVFALVNDFHNWQEWSPWAKLDPAAKVTFEGPSSGEGAIFRWNGNDEVGEGSMTILESQPSEQIRLRLDFVRPFEDTSDVEFTFQPTGEQTEITWIMTGQHNFLSKAMCLLMNLDEMLGSDFERGLASIKAQAESQTRP